MANPAERRASFDGRWPTWAPTKPSVDELVKAGFCYTGEKDRVECFECKQRLEGWEEGDDPLVEHAKHASDCPFVKSKGTIYRDQAPRTVSDCTTGIPPSMPHDMVDAGPGVGRTARYPYWADKQKRTASFGTGWQGIDHKKLANLGFFYYKNDKGLYIIQCYQCGTDLDTKVTIDELQKRHMNCPLATGHRN